MEDVISLRSEGDVTQAEHYTFLSRVTEKIEATGTVVVTVKPGALEPAKKLDTAGEQFDVDLNLPPRRLQVTGSVAEKTSRVPLAEADVVVAGGRGMGSADEFARLVEGLAGQARRGCRRDTRRRGCGLAPVP